MASFAAIFAIGNPVALEASAEDRETRGFISMTMTRPVSGSTANWIVAPAGVDADRADDVDRDVTEVLVLAIGERERRRDGDRVAGVDADRVDVLDRAHDDAVVRAVAHELELVLLPAEDRLLEEHLVRRRLVNAVGDHPIELGLGVREAGSEPAHRERGPDDERQPEVVHRDARFGHVVDDVRARDLGAGRDDEILEELAVLAAADRVDLRADELDAVALEDAGLVERDRGVERGLAAERREDRVGPLLRDDRLDDRRRDRLDIRRVGESGVGHDRRRVRVHEDDPDALLAEDAAGLRAGVVEFGGLSDDDRTGSDDEDRADVVTPWQDAP